MREESMPTKELRRPLEPEAPDLRHEALTMALEILRERIGRLPQSDKDDLFELVKTLSWDDPEELESSVVTMREILEQRPTRVRRMEFPSDPNEHSGALSKWIKLVSRRISKERENAGLTQDELAKRTGLPQSHISRLETGKHSPSRATIEKIAAALGKSLSDFDPSR
jgi:DNA-binding XRE family transcriptional regulator